MNGNGDHSHRHGQDCRCLINPGCLREIRRRRVVSLEAVSKMSGYSREYLAALERGDGGACVVAEVLVAYEQAMGVPVEEEVLHMIGDFARALWSGHETLTRLYWFRAQHGQTRWQS